MHVCVAWRGMWLEVAWSMCVCVCVLHVGVLVTYIPDCSVIPVHASVGLATTD